MRTRQCLNRLAKGWAGQPHRRRRQPTVARLLADLADAQREIEALSEAARQKDELLSQVSHELRAPLTIIHGYAELIADGHLSDKLGVRSSAREIRASASLTLRLVDDLLDTSRLDAGRLELRLQSVDLAGWLEQTTATFARSTPSHHFVADLPEALPRVRVDVDRLGQVMNNLLSNAARYSARGSEVRVTAHVFDAGRVEIQVSDEGAGIAPEECERIFDKFYRGQHGARLASRGAGLGLSVARALVEAHGGQIGVRSTLGRGSTFWVRLPAEVASLVGEPPVWIDPAALAA